VAPGKHFGTSHPVPTLAEPSPAHWIHRLLGQSRR